MSLPFNHQQKQLNHHRTNFPDPTPKPRPWGTLKHTFGLDDVIEGDMAYLFDTLYLS